MTFIVSNFNPNLISQMHKIALYHTQSPMSSRQSNLSHLNLIFYRNYGIQIYSHFRPKKKPRHSGSVSRLNLVIGFIKLTTLHLCTWHNSRKLRSLHKHLCSELLCRMFSLMSDRCRVLSHQLTPHELYPHHQIVL